MRSPDKIKKGLECCQDYQSCTKYDETQCPYYDVKGCVDTLLADALAYIQQLESDKQQLEGMLTHMNQLRDAAAGRALQMEERVHQLEAERDAAIRDMTGIVQEYGEPYCDYCGADFKPNCKGKCWTHNEGFKWRGVQKED